MLQLYYIRSGIKETAEQSKQTYDSTLSDIDSIKSELDGVKDKIDKINNGSIKVTKDGELQKLQTTNDELERQLRVKQELAQIQGKQAEKDAVDAYNASGWHTQWGSGEYGNGLVNVVYRDDLSRFNDNLNMVKKYNQQLDELKTKYDNGTISAEEYNSQQGKINSNMATYESYLSDAVTQLQKTRDSLIGSTSEGNDLANNIDIALASFDDFYKSAPNISDANNNVATSSDEVTTAEEEQAKALQATADEINKLKTNIDNMQSAYQNLNTLVTDYNNNGYMSIDNLQALADNGASYLQYLTLEDGKLKISKTGYYNLINAQLDEIETQQLLQATSDIQALTDEASAREYLAQTTSALASSNLDAAEAQFQLYYAQNMAKGGAIAEATQQIANNVSAFQNIVEQTRSKLSSYGSEIEGVSNSTSSASNSTDEYTKSLNAEIKALGKEKSALDNRKTALENSKQDMEEAKSSVSDLVSLVEDMVKKSKELEKDTLEKTRDAELDAIEQTKTAIQGKISAQQELLDKEKEAFEFNKKVKDYQNSVASDTLKQAITSLDDSSAGRKAYKSATDSLNGSKSTLNDYLYEHQIDVRNDNLSDVSKGVDDYYNKLSDSIKESYDKQIDTISDFLSNERKMYETACSMIDNDNGTLYNQLYTYVNTYTTKSDSEFNRLWTNAQTAIENYGGANISVMGLMDLLQGRIYNTEDAIKGVAGSIDAVNTQISNANDTLADYQSTLATIADTVNQINSVNGYQLNFDGKTFKSSSQDMGTAARELQAMVQKYLASKGMTGRYELAYALKNMQAYADGTMSAKGGLSLVGEKGAELRVLNQGDGILPNGITSTLLNFAQNPVSFLQNLPSNNTETNVTNNIKPEIKINITGNADSNTVNAIARQADKIADMAAQKVMNKAVNNRRMI